MKLKENAWPLVVEAMSEKLNKLKVLMDQGNTAEFVNVLQCDLLSYEDIIEPSKLNLEDEFWSCFSINEKQSRTSFELNKVLEYMKANKMAAAMDEIANIKNKCYISDTSARQVFHLVEDFLNNKEEYEI